MSRGSIILDREVKGKTGRTRSARVRPGGETMWDATPSVLALPHERGRITRVPRQEHYPRSDRFAQMVLTHNLRSAGWIQGGKVARERMPKKIAERQRKAEWEARRNDES